MQMAGRLNLLCLYNLIIVSFLYMYITRTWLERESFQNPEKNGELRIFRDGQNDLFQVL